ncbi:hypothetical protein BOTBODRAFT_251704 [Botryobasidium botryosum FD-172 SS1]|uniref:ribonuclease H n=1 Tax=Botryobasidium botryosum (strain FD-172 SS1) TaxID=930990 RepID=A0A067MP98_BOTB1|nr:hypothetical protein BOTBODRAFT_251704 [Botryobasidium botryosum FD-172 SS1]
MPKSKAKGGFYAVKRGHKPGVYSTWGECEVQIKGFPGALHKKFGTLLEAQEFAGVANGPGSPSSVSATTSASTSSASTHSKKPYDRTAKGKKVRTGPSEPDLPLQEGEVVVYTDGACKNNGKPRLAAAGVGVWWGEGDKRNISERCPGDQTNNRAELITTSPMIRLRIKTDSIYCISCMKSWLPTWRKRGFKTSNGQPIKNQSLILYLASLLDNRPGLVRFQHVFGHQGEQGNEGADRLAVAGCDGAAIPERNWEFKGWEALGFEGTNIVEPGGPEMVELLPASGLTSGAEELFLTPDEFAEFYDDIVLSE